MTKPLLIGFFVVCLAGTAGSAAAGDYYTYRDPKGNLVLSNNPPPPSGRTLKKETLPEVTDQELAEARMREEAAARDNRITNLERTIDDLEYRLRNQPPAPDYALPAHGDSGVSVGVANGFVWPAHRPKPAPNPRPNPRAPAPPSTLPGGIIPGGSLPGGKLG